VTLSGKRYRIKIKIILSPTNKGKVFGLEKRKAQNYQKLHLLTFVAKPTDAVLF
jgi:hypothetical protein